MYFELIMKRFFEKLDSFQENMFSQILSRRPRQMKSADRPIHCIRKKEISKLMNILLSFFFSSECVLMHELH